MSIKVLSVIDNESGVPVIEGANGLSVTGNYMTLGGTLSGTTTIDGAGYAIDFGTVSSKLGSFDLISSGASTIQSIGGINMVNSTTGDFVIDAQTNSQLVLKSQSGSVAGDLFTNAIGFNVDFAADAFTIVDNRATAKGIEYLSNYSGDYTDRSLVDKAYVDSVASGLDPKDASIVGTTANIDLTGGTFVSGTTIDGIVVNDGWRVLVKNQTDAIENGIYDYSASASGFTRSSDFDGTPANEVSSGAFTFVVTGDTLSSTSWIVTTPDPITVGTTEINFTIGSSSFDLTDGTGTTITIDGGNRSVSVELAPSSGLDFDAGAASGRLRIAASFAGTALTLSSGVLSVDQSTTSTSGYLSSTDWNTFNNKTTCTGTVTAANGVNNRVATFSSATALNGEANLTFDGTTLTGAANVSSCSHTTPNPNNASASATLSWLSDNPRIRIGGSGAGSSGAFQVQGTGDGIRMSLDSGSNLCVTATIKGTVLCSAIATGTAPLTVASTTTVTNLSADRLDGISSGSFLRSDVADTKTSGNLNFSDNIRAVFGNGSDFQISHCSALNDFILESNSGTAQDILFRTQSTTRFTFDNGTFKGTATDWIATSDVRLKENFTHYGSVLEKINSIKGSLTHFDWKETGVRDVGFIAQEIKPIFPEFVEENASKNDDTEYMAISYGKLSTVAIEGVAELNEKLENEVSMLKEQIDDLTELVNKLIDK